MRVPLSWLREYVSFDLSPEQLAEELTMRGMEVSHVEVTGADWSGVVVARRLGLCPVGSGKSCSRSMSSSSRRLTEP